MIPLSTQFQRADFFHTAQIHLPYPNQPLDSSPNAEALSPFLLRFEGSHVLRGLTAAISLGYADDGLPSWIREIGKEGRNATVVGLSE